MIAHLHRATKRPSRAKRPGRACDYFQLLIDDQRLRVPLPFDFVPASVGFGFSGFGCGCGFGCPPFAMTHRPFLVLCE